MKRLFHPRLFQFGLIVAVLAISYLAFTPHQHKIAEQATDKINHLVAFVTLAWLIDGAFRPWCEHWLIKTTTLLGYGLVIECVQYFIPCREFSLLDVLADGLGVALYYLIAFGALRVLRVPEK